MTNKDYYNTLGINKNATEADIKKAYRKAAMKHHPDKGGDEAEFKKINEAYETLGDKQKRTNYDQFGNTEGASNGFGGASSGFGSGGIDMDIGDIFSSFFGGESRGGRSKSARSEPRGYDMEMVLDISFEESIFGVEKKININRDKKCNTCNGTGAKNSKTTTCHTCGGSGQTMHQQQTPFGVFQSASTCHTCNGEGQTATEICTICSGTGVREQSEKISVQIPAGIENGSSLRMRGYGSAIKRGSAGDLFIRIHVSPSKEYTRQGNNLIKHINIHILQAILGGKAEITTLYGKKKIKIPAGIKIGTILKISGVGVKNKGDLLLKVNIEIPNKISNKEKKLYKELAEQANIDTDDTKTNSIWSF